MKKIKSPYYALVWVGVWTAALIWFLTSGMFTFRENVGLVIVWLVLVGITVYLLVQYYRKQPRRSLQAKPAAPATPALNALCPCGSGKKYKRCCGAAAHGT
ncbi:MAG: SEC-C metal-binding domain-containing protein [Thermodesulfobacteriota bacterium]